MKKIYTLIAFFSIACNAYTQHRAGTLDSTFGQNGIVIYKPSDFGLYSYDIAFQSDGKIICVGDGISVIRFNMDGSLDSSFGNSGLALLGFGYTYNVGKAVAIQPDDKIVITGYGLSGMFDPDYDMVVARLNQNGSLDSSFGREGKMTADFSKNDQANDIAIQPDGKILIFGTTDNRFNLLRYLPDGKPDESFGNNGNVLASYSARGNAITLQSDGKIVAAGSYDNKITLARYMPDGSVDVSFGTNGRVVSAFGQEYNTANDVVVQPDGQIVIAGNVSNFLTNNLLLARYNTNGAPDVSFGTNGFVIPNFGYSSTASKLVLQKDGKIVAGGNTGDALNGPHDFLLVRFKDGGSLDSSFALNGQQKTKVFDNSNAYTYGYGLTLTNTNKIILAGGTTNGNNSYASIVRYYNNDSTPPPTPITRIKRWLRKHGITWDDCPPSICDNITGYAVQRSTNSVNWTTIFRSRSSANPQQVTANNYGDPSPLPGTNYYRLQTTSVSGAVANSNVIAVTSDALYVSLSPNPAKNSLSIAGLPANEKVKVTVVDFSGNVKLQTVANASSYNLNIASLHAGNYVIKMDINGEVVSRQFVKE